jgi:glycosyltransferase involved in cell wall biosynthesis
MKSTLPIVSVIIPAFNVRNYIADSIESALSQTYQNIEIIVVDDGSTDGTNEIINSYGDKIQCLKKSNGGAASARNLGINAARGKYISFLDGDDTWEPHKLVSQIEQFNINPRLGLVYADYGSFNENGVISKNKPLSKGSKRPSGYILRDLIFDCFISTCTATVSREALNRVGGFNETLIKAEDYDLWLRIAAVYEVEYLPKVLTWVRERPDSLSRSYSNAVEHWETTVVMQALSQYANELSGISHRKMKQRLARPYFEQGYESFWNKHYLHAFDNFKCAFKIYPCNYKLIIYMILSYFKRCACFSSRSGLSI